MSSFFHKNFQQLIKSQFNVNLQNSKEVKKAIQNFRSVHDIKDYRFLQRLPRKDLKSVLRMECPVTDSLDVKDYKNYQVIKHAKDLRFSMGIDESSVCFKCSKKDTCKFKDEVPENNKKAQISDLLILLNALSDIPKLKEIQDQDDADSIDFRTNEFKIEYKNKEWMSALKVTDSLSVILQDLIQNNQIESKTFLNFVIEEQKNHPKQQSKNFEIHQKQRQKYEKENIQESESDSDHENSKQIDEKKQNKISGEQQNFQQTQKQQRNQNKVGQKQFDYVKKNYDNMKHNESHTKQKLKYDKDIEKESDSDEDYKQFDNKKSNKLDGQRQNFKQRTQKYQTNQRNSSQNKIGNGNNYYENSKQKRQPRDYHNKNQYNKQQSNYDKDDKFTNQKAKFQDPKKKNHVNLDKFLQKSDL